MNKFIYISATDINIQTSQVSTGFYYVNPFDNSTDYYTALTDGGNFGNTAWTKSLTGYTFDSDLYVKKRTNFLNFSQTYSEYVNFVFSLSAIQDRQNSITKVLFEPEEGVLHKGYLENNTAVYDKSTAYKQFIGTASDNNPKNILYNYKYNLAGSEDINHIFVPKLSCYRQDGFVDEFIIELNVSKDSIYNIADQINLLDMQVMPLSSKDPLVKIELENPDYVNHFVLKQKIKPTPTPTHTPSSTREKTPTQTPTPTYTATPTNTVTRSGTPTQTPTQTKTPTQQGSRVIREVIIPTPTPSLSPDCKSKVVRVHYTGLNDVDPSTVSIALRGSNGLVFYYFGKTLKKVLGDNYIDINVPIGETVYKLQPYIEFTDEDPIINVTNWNVVIGCSQDEIDNFTPTPKIQDCLEGQERDPITGECVTKTGCPEGYHQDKKSGECCPPDKFDIVTGECSNKICSEGMVWDEDIQKCVPIVVIVDPPPCEEGFVYNPVTKLCDPIVEECPEGYIRNEDGDCVLDQECEEGEIYDEATNSCRSVCCPDGTTFDPVSRTCRNLECPAGYKLTAAGCIPICINGGTWNIFNCACDSPPNMEPNTAFTFAYADTVPAPILCDIPGAPAGGGLDARSDYNETGPQMVLGMKISWQVFLSSKGLDELRESIASPVDGQYQYMIPDSGVAVSGQSGVFNAEATKANTQAVIGQTILTPYPTIESFYTGNTKLPLSTFIVYKIEYWTNGNDYEWYRTWSREGSPCTKRKEATDYINGLESGGEDYQELAMQNQPLLPTDTFKPTTQVDIQPMEDYQTFLDKLALNPDDVRGYADKIITWS